MKTMKVALLASAALAAVSVSARADDVAALKAQLEALNARVAQLETAPAVPIGFSLLTISEGTVSEIPGLPRTSKQIANEGNEATVIGIMPTADVPASTTIEWWGYVRSAIVYNDYDDSHDIDDGDNDVDDDSDVSVRARGQLNVTAKTDTAVGEVGVRLNLRAEDWYVDTKSPVTMNEAWGWWAMTPELTLGGGYAGTLGNVGYGYDGACSCYYIDNADVYTNPGDAVQMRLSWASGPFSFAAAVEDATGSNAFSTNGDNSTTLGVNNGFSTDDGLGVAAKVKYSGDTVSGEINGLWRQSGDLAYAPIDDTSVTVNAVDSWIVGAGLGFSLGEMASFSFAGNFGRTNYDADFWDVNGLVSANLSDSIHAELAAGYKSYDYSGVSATPPIVGLSGADVDIWSVMGGLYYEPVSQLTIGLEAEYSETDQDQPVGSKYTEDRLTVDLVTVFRF